MSLFVDDLEFEFVGPIEPSRDGDEVVAHMPQRRYREPSAPLNRYGAGPFCSFKVAKGHRRPGVYLIQKDTILAYVGECKDLAARYRAGYGVISPRNCFKGGQETNCRINNLIYQAAMNGSVLSLWFFGEDGGKAARMAIEKSLIEKLGPCWNR